MLSIRFDSDRTQPISSDHVLYETKSHSYSSRPKTPMPGAVGIKAERGKEIPEPLGLRQETHHDRRKKSSHINHHVKDRKAGVTALVTRRVQLPNHGADVRLQQASATGD